MTNRIVRIVRARPAAPRVLGIDPSLSSTGFAYRDDAGQLVRGTIATGKLRGPHRLFYARQRMATVLSAAKPTLIVYEDYAMGVGKGGMTFTIGELGGILKTLFWENGFDVMLVSPSTLKLAITGHGQAEKFAGEKKRKQGKKPKAPLPNMRDSLLHRFGYDVAQNDEVDAVGLMLIGENKLLLGSSGKYDMIHGRGNNLKSIAKRAGQKS